MISNVPRILKQFFLENLASLTAEKTTISTKFPMTNIIIDALIMIAEEGLI